MFLFYANVGWAWTRCPTELGSRNPADPTALSPADPRWVYDVADPHRVSAATYSADFGS